MAKKPITLYQFYRAFIGVESKATVKQKQNFARSIGLTESIIAAAFRERSFNLVEEYFNKEKKHALTEKFLNNFLLNVQLHNVFFNKFHRYEFVIEIPCEGKYDYLRLRQPYLYCEETNSFIILTYGPSENTSYEFGIFTTLGSFFSSKTNFESVNSFEYWDLMNGEQEILPIAEVKTVHVSELTEAINRLST